MRPLLVLGSMTALLAMAAIGIVGLARSAPRAVTTDETPAAAEAAGGVSGPAYNLVAADGTMYRFGEPRTAGDLAGRAGVSTLVALDGGIDGFWATTADGRVFAVGKALGAGSVTDLTLSAPVVAIAGAPARDGYWLAASDGGVFAQGSAAFFGSAAGLLSAPLSDIAPTPSGQGYWVLAEDGSVYAFGDAMFFGAANTAGIDGRAVEIVAAPDGAGYWILSGTGSVYTFGSATHHGSGSEVAPGMAAVALVATADGGGYWIVDAAGSVFTFGSAPFLGAASAGETPPSAPIIGIVATAG